MELIELKEILFEYINKLSTLEKERVITELESSASIYPFNEYEFIITNLLSKEVLVYKEYIQIRSSYISKNMYLPIIEIPGPRQFGETRAQSHIMSLDERILKPNISLDGTYSGKYDLLVMSGKKNVRIEVKASRGLNNTLKDEPYAVKALSYPPKHPFDMNFQQVKLDYADVFIFVAVWRNKISYWVLTSKEIESSGYYNDKQHSKSKGEGQIHFKNHNISFFDLYLTKPNKMAESILAAYKRSLK